MGLSLVKLLVSCVGVSGGLDGLSGTACEVEFKDLISSMPLPSSETEAYVI